MTIQKKFVGGFTLIELLVVIAIIGILSSVILSFLGTARGKGSDASVKSNLNNMRSQAEIVYDTAGGSYAGVCINASVIKAVNAARLGEGLAAWATTADNLITGGCTNAAGTYVLWVNLAKGSTPTNYWCVDHTGTSIQKTLAPTTNAPIACGNTAAVAW